MDCQQAELYQRIEQFSLDRDDADFTFTQRLARENGWSREYSERVIAEYKKFAFLAVVAGHPVTPSDQVDQVWHLHLTYTRSYWEEFCSQILQKPLHHEPTRGGGVENEKFHDWYGKTLASYESLFQTQPPRDIWSPVSLRFSRDLNFQRVNTQQNWVLPKPNLNWNRPLKLAFSLLLVLVIGLFSFAAIAQAGLTFYWDAINVNVDVQTNGDLLVTETQKYVFTENHSNERYRFIKLDKIDKITDVAVFEEDKQLPVDTYINNNKFWIRWQHELKAPQTDTFVLKYRVSGAIETNEQSDELYWKAIAPKRAVPVNHAKVTVTFPEQLAGKVEHFHSLGAITNVTQLDSKTLEFVSRRPISSNDYLALKADFPHNILNLTPPKWQNSSAKENTLLPQNSFASFAFFVAMVLLAVFIVAIGEGSRRRIRSTRKGDSDSSSGFGGCGGCGGGGCGGGGCGGGG